MKKALFVLSISAILGGAIMGHSFKTTSVFAFDEEVGEVGEIEEVGENQEKVNLTISNWANDTIEIIKTFCNQPIVIGGVATTVGAVFVFVLGKVFSNLGKKGTKEVVDNLSGIAENLKNFATKKDYNGLVAETKTLYAVLMELLPSIKNVNVRANCEKLLEEIKPQIEETKNFIEEQVEETKNFAEDELTSVVNELLK